MLSRRQDTLALPAPRAGLRWRLSDTQFALALLAPVLLLLTATVLYPLARGIYLGFRAHSLVNPFANGWIGFQNYETLLRNPAFRDVWVTTLVFVAGSVAGQFLLGFLTALVLNNPGI